MATFPATGEEWSGRRRHGALWERGADFGDAGSGMNPEDPGWVVDHLAGA
jgi:hypothetical protein